MCVKERDEQSWGKKKPMPKNAVFHKIIAEQIESRAEPDKYRQPVLHSHDRLKSILRQREME